MAEAMRKTEERVKSTGETGVRPGSSAGAVARAALFLIRREDVVIRPALARPAWIALRDLAW